MFGSTQNVKDRVTFSDIELKAQQGDYIAKGFIILRRQLLQSHKNYICGNSKELDRARYLKADNALMEMAQDLFRD